MTLDFNTQHNESVSVFRLDGSIAWSGTVDEFSTLLDAIRNRTPIPWCTRHDGPAELCCDRLTSTDLNCRLEDSPTRWRIATWIEATR